MSLPLDLHWILLLGVKLPYIIKLGNLAVHTEKK